MCSLSEKLEAAVAAIRQYTDIVPETAMILGSGLGSLADQVENPVEVPYKDIPGFSVSTVHGHVGSLVLGTLEGRYVAILKGRVHYYEGHKMENIIFPVRVLHALGAKTLVVTNAAGGINEKLNVGDLMLITDHINFMGANPLVGPNDEKIGPRFPPMSRAYTPELQEVARKVAKEVGFNLAEGVYVAMSGPSYETPAEIRMLKGFGADVVGMSTVPEVIAAAHCGLKVIGISCVTNVLHKGPSKDTHEDVLKAAADAKPRFINLVRGIVRELGK
ncbi:purine-nucleoside phosphorylase [bacterium]|nr:purine-nucleoside phosphorylase [bacterium]